MTIYLEPNEEVTSVVDHLIQVKSEEVVFVVPIGAQIIQSLINLKILKREADNLKKKIILVTQDEQGQKIAKKAGIETHSSADKIAQFFNPSASLRTNIIGGVGESIAYSDSLGGKEPARSELVESAFLETTLSENNLPDYSADVSIPLRAQLSSISAPQKSWEGEIILASARGADKETIGKEVNLRQYTHSRHLSDRGPLKVTDIITPPPVPHKPSVQEKIFGDSETEYDYEEDNLVKTNQRLAERKYLHQHLQEVGQQLWSLAGDWFNSLFSYFDLRKISISLSLLVLVVFIWLGLVILPQADIILYPETEPFATELPIKAEKNISRVDASANKIPAQLIKMEQGGSREFISTGEKQVNEKARGKITIYNAYSSSPQILVETTRFLSGDGKLFRLPQKITVPGAKIEEGKIVANSVEAEVVADEPGQSFNITASNFTIPGFQGTPKYTAFYAKSNTAMIGGMVGRAKIVSQDDYSKAKEILIQELQDKARAQFKNEMPTDYTLLDGAIIEKLGAIDAMPAVGSVADKFVLNTKIVVEGLIFSNKEAETLIGEKIRSQLTEKRDFVDKSLAVDYKKVSADFNSGAISLSAGITGKTIHKIDLKILKDKVRGKNEAELKQIFSGLQEIESVKINFWPFWTKRVPNKISKISISTAEK